MESRHRWWRRRAGRPDRGGTGMTGGGRGGGGMNAFPEMTADSTGREADFKAVL